MPEVTDDGRTYTFRLRKGIYFTPDPAFKGAAARARRRRTSSTRSSASSIRPTARRTRSCSKARSRASTRSPPRRSKSGKFDYDAQAPGPRGGRPLHAAHPPRARRLQLPATSLAHTSVRRRRARSDRRLRRATTDGASGRHRRPTCSSEWKRASQDRARGQSRLPRLRLGLRGHAGDAVGRRADRGDEGQDDAADRPRRDQRSSRRTSRGGSRSARSELDILDLPSAVPHQGVRRRTTS